jgi:hypothetical protein
VHRPPDDVTGGQDRQLQEHEQVQHRPAHDGADGTPMSAGDNPVVKTGTRPGMTLTRTAAASLVALCGTLAWATSAQAVDVGSGTFATPLGPVDWNWKVSLKPTLGGRVTYVRQTLTTNAAFNDTNPLNEVESDRVPLWHGRLRFQTRETPTPVVVRQYYPYDTQTARALPVNLTGIVTLADVTALKLHYVYGVTAPSGPGTEDLVLTTPSSSRTLHRTKLKFWLAAANGGAGGYVYDLQTAEGKVRICHKRCRWYWKLIYKWPPWSRIAALGRLTRA